MRRILYLVCFCLFLTPLYAQETVSDISWDGKDHVLRYFLKHDSILRIRAGAANGPIYSSIVNGEERKAGAHREPWDCGKALGIDLEEYGTLHFCVDPTGKKENDLDLAVVCKYLAGDKLRLTLDIEDKDRSGFAGDGLEVMAYVDGRLVKLEKAKSLPFDLELSLIFDNAKYRLVSLNVWAADHSRVAYKSLVLRQKAGAEPGKIAYCRRHRGYWQVWVKGLDPSSPERRLTGSPVDKRYPAISPDGRSVAYVTNNGELRVCGSDGKGDRKIDIPVHCSQPRWHPEGKKIAFVSYQDLYHGDSKIWQVDLATSKLRKITNRPWFQFDVCYSPDGKDLIFTEGPELYRQDIRRLDLATGDVTQVTDNRTYDFDMQAAYSPDGQSIVYSSNEAGTYDIWLSDRFGMNKRNLVSAPSHDIMPYFAENRIYFLSDRSGTMQVWRMGIDGSGLEQVTSGNEEKMDLNVYPG